MLRDVLNMDQQQNKAGLEGWAYEMSWDWDAEDINPDENNSWEWFPITPKTLEDKARQFTETKPAQPFQSYFYITSIFSYVSNAHI